ncbi:MAG: tyrosine-type recombinase/integrase family protein [Microthrixaceae bacterium]|nr:tyrosine-type recombinase/integrase family protein [Microthrixaceae bacterium]
MLADRAAGTATGWPRHTVEEYLLDRWLPTKRSRRLEDTTVDDYEYECRKRIIPYIGHHQLSELRTAHVTDYLARYSQEITNRGKPRSPVSVEKTHRILSVALNDAVRWQLMATNVADGAKKDLPRQEQEDREDDWWPRSDLLTWLEGIREDRLYALWMLYTTQGIRRGEGAGLLMQELDLENRTANLFHSRVHLRSGPKTKDTVKNQASRRTLRLGEQTTEALRLQLERREEERLALGARWHAGDHVFTGVKGGPIRPDRITSEFRRLNDELGLPRIKLHNLRHSFITAARDAGIDSRTTAEIVGHDGDETTRRIYERRVDRLHVEATNLLEDYFFGGQE